jgi:hypothetical protein
MLGDPMKGERGRGRNGFRSGEGVVSFAAMVRRTAAETEDAIGRPKDGSDSPSEESSGIERDARSSDGGIGGGW